MVGVFLLGLLVGGIGVGVVGAVFGAYRAGPVSAEQVADAERQQQNW